MILSLFMLTVSALPQATNCWNSAVYQSCQKGVTACWSKPWQPSNQAECTGLQNACLAKARVCGSASPTAATQNQASSVPKPAPEPAPKPAPKPAPQPAPKPAPKPAPGPPASQQSSSAAGNRVPQKASTTRYSSRQNGACEFSNVSKGPAAAINHQSYFPSSGISGHDNIGVACNTCWQITAKGVAPLKITITDNCPDAGWCTLGSNGKNPQGYGLHFDLNQETMPAEWKALDNPIVDAVPVSC